MSKQKAVVIQSKLPYGVGVSKDGISEDGCGVLTWVIIDEESLENFKKYADTIAEVAEQKFVKHKAAQDDGVCYEN